MTIEQALELLKKIGADFRGNLQDHQAIQQALQVVGQAVKQDNTSKTAEPNGNKKK
jgi:hypothetical protein